MRCMIVINIVKIESRTHLIKISKKVVFRSMTECYNGRPELKKRVSTISLRICGRVLIRLLLSMEITLTFCRKLMENHMLEDLLMAGS